jgi:hypothetical protein
LASIVVTDAAAQITDPDKWFEEGVALAKQYAYAPPVSTGKNAVLLTRDYETHALNVARGQAALAGARPANILSAALK